MRNQYIRVVAQAIVQMVILAFFLLVLHWNVFFSLGLSAVIGMAFGFVLYLMQKPKTPLPD